MTFSRDGRSVLLIGAWRGAVWDVASGELKSYVDGDDCELDDDWRRSTSPNLTFASFLGPGDTRALLCGGGAATQGLARLGCRLVELTSEYRSYWQQVDPGSNYRSDLRRPEMGPSGAASLFSGAATALDGDAVVLVRGGGVDWMELASTGRRRHIRVDGASVTAVAALRGGRVAAGLSNGSVVLVGPHARRSATHATSRRGGSGSERSRSAR